MNNPSYNFTFQPVTEDWAVEGGICDAVALSVPGRDLFDVPVILVVMEL